MKFITWSFPAKVLKRACASTPPSHPPKELHCEKSLTSSRGNRMQQEWMKYLYGPHPLRASFQIPATSRPYTELFVPVMSKGGHSIIGLSISLAYSGKSFFKSVFSLPNCIETFIFNLPELKFSSIFLYLDRTQALENRRMVWVRRNLQRSPNLVQVIH